MNTTSRLLPIGAHMLFSIANSIDSGINDGGGDNQ